MSNRTNQIRNWDITKLETSTKRLSGRVRELEATLEDPTWPGSMSDIRGALDRNRSFLSQNLQELERRITY
jgi:hypothetical protein